jgi:hypothetical protein
MMTKRALWAALIFAAGISTGLAFAGRLAPADTAQAKVVLDNRRVTVTEVTVAPQGRREPYTRPSDQIIVFIDEAEYEATDAAGKKQTKRRRPGEIVWHSKGEAAPLLVNVGRQPYRNLVIALK